MQLYQNVLPMLAVVVTRSDPICKSPAVHNSSTPVMLIFAYFFEIMQYNIIR